MDKAVSNTPPLWFWILAALGLVWNLMGLMAFVMHMNLTPQDIAALSDAEQALYQSTPIWATAAFAIAVCAGTAGSLLLLFKRGLSVLLLVVSLIAVLIQNAHSLLMSNAVDVYGSQAIIMPTLVIAIGLGLIKLAKTGQHRGWVTS
ncbi:hypothetical protein [Paraferrimonas sedimenticola]|uniref:Sugar transporter n=1 Tax=Paraferrimonas sedimenticola TaxID=375674 RepID=A0AA37RZA5_9GAMM|nr:hypothetical protein [Paraferrimonas sedimenticola]GLP98119.1 hypothetical protein GCM10007895_34260 [Paraferrimonas sedimenticola]